MKKLLLYFFFLFCTVAFGQGIDKIPKNGLLAFYPFNGNANDISANVSNGIATDVTLTPDRFGNINSAYSFNGTSSNIEADVKNYPLKGASRTITGWFKANSPIVSQEFDFCLLNYGNITDPKYWFNISFYRKGYLNVQFDSKIVQSQENYFNNEWTFIALTFNQTNNTYSLYVNNIFKMSGIASLYTNGFGNLFRIGRNKLNNYFEGEIDDIGIWNRVLTREEMNLLYNSQSDNSLYTLIPDVNFEKKLIALGIDYGVPDGKVHTVNVELLTSLDVSSSSISNLTGIQDFVSLKSLNCSSNQLMSLDVSKNVVMTSLNCSSNQLISLDVSKNVALKYFQCYSNKLEYLNLKNGNNTLLVDPNSKTNPNLTCIQVDDAIYSNTKWSTFKDATASYNSNCSSSYTLIPDSSFEKKLIALGIDSGITDGKVLTSKISSLTSLDVISSSITDLTGIQDFVALQTLNCSTNQLTSLDLSKNVALTSLSCYSNQLKSLDVSLNVSLKKLYCNSNQLTSLDVSKNSTLTYLSLASNKITTIDVSSNNELQKLSCNLNLLSELNITNNTSIIELNCSYNQLKSLNVTKNVNLNYFYCFNNYLTSIDVSRNINLLGFMCNSNEIKTIDVSNNQKLDFFDCLNNSITSLDISKNSLLTELACQNNQLTYLNLKNGANTILNLTFSNFTNNPNLTCIQVDDATYSNTNWVNIKDATASYNTNCDPSYTLIPDSSFEQKLIDLGIDTDGLNGKISVTDISSVTSLNLSNSTITDLTGIEIFTGLTFLDCSLNQLTSLDLSKNIFLETLNASSNQITSLDLSQNSKLTTVYVVGNPLTYLNIQNGNNINFILPSITGKKKAASLATTFLGISTLGCIKVDNSNYSNTNWSRIKESTTTFSESCTLGLEDSFFQSMSIYPNPTKEILHLDNMILEKITIYNSLGEFITTKKFVSSTNNDINLSGLATGIYFAYIHSEGRTIVKKIIIE